MEPVKLKPGWLQRDVDLAAKRAVHWSRGMSFDRCPCDSCAHIRGLIKAAGDSDTESARATLLSGDHSDLPRMQIECAFDAYEEFGKSSRCSKRGVARSPGGSTETERSE